MRPGITVLTALSIACTLGLAQAADAPADTSTIERIVAHHFACASVSSTECQMKDYADDAVFINQDGVMNGKAAIMAQFKKNGRQRHLKPLTPTVTSPDSFTAEQFSKLQYMQFVDGRTIQFVHRYYTPNIAFIMSVNNAGRADQRNNVQTIIIRNGKIIRELIGNYAGHFVAPSARASRAP